jgi:hypothetical protein
LIPIATGDLLHEIDEPMAHRVVAGIGADLTMRVREVGSVAHQPADFDVVPEPGSALTVAASIN